MTAVANLTLKTKTRSWRFALTNALPKGHSFCRRAIRFAEGRFVLPKGQRSKRQPRILFTVEFRSSSTCDVYQNYFIISGSTDNVWSVMLYWFIECQPFVREQDTCRPLCAEKESSSSCGLSICCTVLLFVFRNCPCAKKRTVWYISPIHPDLRIRHHMHLHPEKTLPKRLITFSLTSIDKSKLEVSSLYLINYLVLVANVLYKIKIILIF